ncbi:MAG: hypothetical protein AAFZ63_15545 [Bacteroidota bacterium]
MSLRKKASLIIYRFRERGLEVLLNDSESEHYRFPEGEIGKVPASDAGIELDPVQEQDGKTQEAFAFESDWHEIPSLKAMLYEDAVQFKEKVKEVEKGAFVGIKDALKNALPHQYAFLKELKDILRDRNSLRDL